MPRSRREAEVDDVMKLFVPYTYLKPSRTPEGIMLPSPVPALWVSSFEIDVPEIAASAAPVVATWTRRKTDGREIAVSSGVCRHDGRHFYVLAGINGDEENRTSALDGTYVRPRGAAGPGFDGISEYLTSGASTSARNLWHALHRRRSMAAMDCFETAFRGEKVYLSASLSEARRHPQALVDTRDEDLAAATARAEKTVVIDGILWRRVHEPKLRLSVERWYDPAFRGHVDVDFGDGHSDEKTGWRPRPREATYFPLSGSASLTEILAKLSLPLNESVAIENVSILAPELFVFDSWANHAFRTMVEALDSYAPSVGSMDALLADTFVELREQVSTLGPGSTSQDVEAAVLCYFEEFLCRVDKDALYEDTVRSLELFQAPPEDALEGLDPD